MATTSTLVKQVYETSKDESAYDPFVATANLIVLEELADSGLTDARKDLIATYLAAHFAMISWEKGGVVRKKLGEADESYREWLGQGLSTTPFGAQVVALDSSGTLVGIITNSGIKALFSVI
jgi:hypothetical protein